MAGGQKNVVLILARELASNIATPMLVLDDQSTLIFFNEPAEQVLGATFSQTGEIPMLDWDARWAVTDLDGTPTSLLDTQLAEALTNQTPAHQSIRVRGLDGTWRTVEATIYPLFASAAQFVGAVAVFWQIETNDVS